MKIAIEAQRIFRKDKHGMDFVILETLKELQKRKDGNEYYVFVAPGEDRCLEESENLHIIELRCPTYPLWEQIALPRAVRKLKADLLHCTSNTAPLWCPVPLVLTLHDIIYLEPRQHRSPSFYQEMGWHYRRLIVPRILKKARKIITVSQFECTRIREALQLPKEVIKAVYNGYSAYFTMQETPDKSIVQKYIAHPDFLFFSWKYRPQKECGAYPESIRVISASIPNETPPSHCRFKRRIYRPASSARRNHRDKKTPVLSGIYQQQRFSNPL